jgi:CubicO group peptidase (beta-lactamase class C family)
MCGPKFCSMRIVAAGTLRLVDQGRLRFDDPVSRYIPSFADVRVFAGPRQPLGGQ